MQASDIVPGLLASAVPTILGAAGIVLRDVYDRRSERGRRKFAIDDAARRVSFITDWLNAKQAIGAGSDELQSAHETAQTWLQMAISQVGESMRPNTRPKGRYSVMRRVLLGYPFERVSAKLLRVLYYLVLLFMAASVTTDVTNLGTYTGGEWGAAASGYILWVLVALGLRVWAVSIEERAARRADSSSPAPAGAPGPMGAPRSYAHGLAPSPAVGWYRTPG